MFFKARQDGKVITKVVNIMGINQTGYKEILGFYASESEGPHFWLTVLNNLKTRGVQDILIAYIDGLNGFPEAINSVFPKIETQLCVIHQIRSSIKHISNKNPKELMADLKTVYKAEIKGLGEYNLLKLEEKWRNKYPMVIKSWQRNWDNFTSYFKYSVEIRKLIYTTNAIGVPG